MVKRMVETLVETLTVRGTRGFMDPHFLQYKRPSTKMNVYNFGPLLLVLVYGEEDVVELVDKAKEIFFLWTYNSIINMMEI